MIRTFNDTDAKLKALKDADGTPHIFRRFNSITEIGIDVNSLPNNINQTRVRHYQGLITRQLISKFKVPSLTRSDYGQLVNVDEALEGIPECYRTVRPVKSVLKMGLNVSGEYDANNDLFALRCAAVIAVFNLARQRGQKVQIDVCYGWTFSLSQYRPNHSHYRTMIQYPTADLICRILSTSAFRNQMIDKGLGAGYQLHALASEFGIKNEFDFVLDRIDTNDFATEEKRVYDAIKHLI